MIAISNNISIGVHMPILEDSVQIYLVCTHLR